MVIILIINTPTSKIHQPSYPCDGHLPLSGSFTELKYKKTTKFEGQKTNKMLRCKCWSNNYNITDKKKGVRVATTCLCCLAFVFLAFPALSMSSDVSRPTVELSWLNNLVCPENSWRDQSLWYLRRLVLGLPLQVPCPPFTLPVKQVLKPAPRVEYLWECAAVALWTQTSCCLLNVSWVIHMSKCQRNGSTLWLFAFVDEKIDTNLTSVR